MAFTVGCFTVWPTASLLRFMLLDFFIFTDVTPMRGFCYASSGSCMGLPLSLKADKIASFLSSSNVFEFIWVMFCMFLSPSNIYVLPNLSLELFSVFCSWSPKLFCALQVRFFNSGESFLLSVDLFTLRAYLWPMFPTAIRSATAILDRDPSIVSDTSEGILNYEL